MEGQACNTCGSEEPHDATGIIDHPFGRTPTCLLCDRGFPLNEYGEHYGTQRKGMIETTRCDLLPPAPAAESKAQRAEGRCRVAWHNSFRPTGTPCRYCTAPTAERSVEVDVERLEACLKVMAFSRANIEAILGAVHTASKGRK